VRLKKKMAKVIELNMGMDQDISTGTWPMRRFASLKTRLISHVLKESLFLRPTKLQA
jgi:hypothetical protein